MASALDLALLEPPLDRLPLLPTALRRRHVALKTLDVTRTFPAPTFVKPGNDKSFPATVYADAEALFRVTSDLSDAMPVLVSEPVIWESEYRVFAKDGEPTAISPYFRNGKLALDVGDGQWLAPPDELADALTFATLVLREAGHDLPAGVVLDVGIITGRGFAVVEANPAWASGLYGCEPIDALDVIAASVYPTGEKGAGESARAAITIEP